MSEQIQLQKHAKGVRPFFFSDPTIDKLLAMLLAACGEVSVLRDRLDTLERVLSESKHLDLNELEKYEPSEEVLADRDERRSQFLKQVFRIIDVDTKKMGRNDVSSEWQSIVEFVNRK